MSLKLSCTVQFHFFELDAFISKELLFLSVIVGGCSTNAVSVHGSISEDFTTNDTLGEQLITSLYESESIVAKSIVTFFCSFSHSFLCNLDEI